MPDRNQPSQRQPVDEQPMLGPRPLVARRGRGAVSNLQGRYEVNGREEFDDGWERDEDEAAGIKTVVTDEHSKRALLSKSSEGRADAVCNQFYNTGTVTGVPSRVKRLSTAARICNSAT